MNQVSEHVNTIFRYVPYVQTNFVLGLDSDSGTEPFELTKRFIDQSPNAFPGFSLLTAFGEAARGRMVSGCGPRQAARLTTRLSRRLQSPRVRLRRGPTTWARPICTQPA